MSDLELNPYAPPATTEQPPAPPPPEEDWAARHNPGRLRLAAILLLVNGVLAVVEKALIASNTPGGSPLGGVLPIIIDALIAVSFLRGNDRYRGFAIFRIVAGMLVTGGIQLSRSDYISCIAIGVGYSGLLLILLGRPRRPRLVIGTVLFGLLVVLEVVGLIAIATGRLGPG